MLLDIGMRGYPACFYLTSGGLLGEELQVQGVDSEAMEAVIKFFYSGECAMTPDLVLPILDAGGGATLQNRNNIVACGI